jgi:hypothetical protein
MNVSSPIFQIGRRFGKSGYMYGGVNAMTTALKLERGESIWPFWLGWTAANAIGWAVGLTVMTAVQLALEAASGGALVEAEGGAVLESVGGLLFLRNNNQVGITCSPNLAAFRLLRNNNQVGITCSPNLAAFRFKN